MKWTHDEAVAMCRQLYAITPAFGGFPALTGGTLYKDGPRKDIDIMIYRSLDEPPIQWELLKDELSRKLGITWLADYGYCKKAITKDGKAIDFFDPHEDGAYKAQTKAFDDA